MRAYRVLAAAISALALVACGANDDASGAAGGAGDASIRAMDDGSAGVLVGDSSPGAVDGGAADAPSDAPQAANDAAESGSDAGQPVDPGDAAAPSSDVVGKITVGYQGWFDAAGDGSGISPPWWHWTPDRNTPTPSDFGIKAWPDMGDYTQTYPTGFANLNSSAPATLYSDWDSATVDTQVQWMQAVGIDTIALQRFADYRGAGEARNVVAAHVRDAAEAHGRKFYITYDISGWTTFDTDLPADWTQLALALSLTASPAYARHQGKPVVAIWGVGYSGHPGTPQTTMQVVTWFQSQGMYVIGGVGDDWRTADGTRWSQAGFGQVFDALDAISPWMIGVIGTSADSDANRATYNEGDVAYLHARGKQYLPCVLPGDLSVHQRTHGDFMWHQFFNMVQIGSDGLYVSMFDEFNEGNQIAKTAATSASVPNGSSFVTLDEDGTPCSPDYYLRLTGDGGKMLKGTIPLSTTRPTPTQ